MLINDGQSIESCQKCLLVKTCNDTKKVSRHDLSIQRSDAVLDACATAKHKNILSWLYTDCREIQLIMKLKRFFSY